MQARALRIHELYDELNRHARGRVWTREEFMLGFVRRTMDELGTPIRAE
ncbi:hypothetical protein [Streptomyces sp. NPDC059209]